MKKNTSIIFLSIFALAISVFGFIGIQPVKANTVLGEGESAITVSGDDIQLQGASLNYAEEATVSVDETTSITTSGNGKLKFYSSYSTTLIGTTLNGKTYKTGTLIARAEDLSGSTEAEAYASLIVGVQSAINVETTDYLKTYNSGADGENDAWWSMVSISDIPRAFYGVQLIARPYVAVEISEGVYEYAYASYDENKTYARSLATTALAKINEGHYNAPESTDDNQVLTELGAKVKDTYTKFKVTFHFDEENSEKDNWKATTTFTLSYGEPLPKLSSIYASNYLGSSSVMQSYINVKGFYNKEQTAFATIVGASVNYNQVTEAVGGEGSATNKYNVNREKHLTRVYGDMNLYEVLAPANLVDDFSTAQSVTAAYTHDGTSRASDNLYYYHQDIPFADATWSESYTDANGVTESGVVAIPSQKRQSTAHRFNYFYFKSSIRNPRFWNKSTGTAPSIEDEEAYYETSNIDYDYLNLRVLVKAANANTKKVTISADSNTSFYANETYTDIPVNTWINVKLSRKAVQANLNRDKIAAYSNSPYYGTSLFYIQGNTSTTTVGEYTLYIDYMAYERDMRIGLVQEDGTLNNGFYLEEVSGVKYPRYNYDDVKSYIGDEVELGTALKSGTIKYTVVDPDGAPVTLSGEALNKFVPAKTGTYKVTANCKDYVLLGDDSTYKYGHTAKQYGEMTFEVLGREVGFELKDVNDIEIGDLTSVKLGDIVKIAGVTVSELDNIDTANVTYEVKYLGTDPATAVTVTDGSFIPNAIGNYSVLVKYNCNGVELVSDSIQFSVIAKEIVAEIYVGEEPIDGQPILMDTDVTIKVFVEGVEVEENVIYKVTHIDSTNADDKNYQFEITNGTFKAGFKGNYKIQVTYMEGEVSHTSEVSTINVVASEGYLNDFSDSASVWASYKLALTASNGADSQYKKIAPTAANAADSIAEGTEWESVYEGRYGVLKVKPQDVVVESTGKFASNYAGALSVALRSYNYPTNADFNSLNDLLYGTSVATVDADDCLTMGMDSDNWDYLSTWVYFENKNVAETDTLTLTAMGTTIASGVRYNTWYELKLDKWYIIRTYVGANAPIREPFTTYAGQVKPLFSLAASTSDEAYEANKDTMVYVDSMAFKTYDTLTVNSEEYTVKRFEEIGLYDNTGVRITGSRTSPYLINYVKDADTGVYTAQGNTEFTIKAKVNDAFVDASKLEITRGLREKWASTDINTYYKWTNTGDVTTSMSGTIKAYDWYKVNVTLTTTTANTALLSTSSAVRDRPRFLLEVMSYDHENKVVYVGYIGVAFNHNDVTPTA